MSTVDAMELGDLRWRKCSCSGGMGDNDSCVELAVSGSVTAVRDSKNPTAGVLGFAEAGWRAFLVAVQRG